MSVTLTADITATERDWHISEPLADGLVYLKADTEFVKVIYISLDQLTIYVMRGVVDTTAATHSAGTALTAANAFSGGGGGVTVEVPPDAPVAVTNIIAPGATIVGDVATLPLGLQRIGPFSVLNTDVGLRDWDTAPGIKLVDLVPGSVVLRAWAVPVGNVSWNPTGIFQIWVSDDNGDFYELAVGYKTDGSHRNETDAITAENYVLAPLFANLTSDEFGTLIKDPIDPASSLYVAGNQQNPKIIVTTGAAGLRAYVYDPGGSPPASAGQMLVYAIIATPAS